jgi:hypothetical protein
MLKVCREVGECGQAGEPRVGRDVVPDSAEGGGEEGEELGGGELGVM